PYRTTLQSWKYCAPAFLVPFMFVLDPAGVGLLLMGSFKSLAEADWRSIALVTSTAAFGIAALAAGLQRWMIRETTQIERWMLIVAGVALVYPKPWADYLGISLIVLVNGMQLLHKKLGAHG
ncbi:MAG TPA: C4-dicarboxylate ABC transporter permease, partial [Burkholderiales bacterium]|nr:C4-dicarboxylate ABC transporter permease [Burkholderiales bacterium]